MNTYTQNALDRARREMEAIEHRLGVRIAEIIHARTVAANVRARADGDDTYFYNDNDWPIPARAMAIGEMK